MLNLKRQFRLYFQWLVGIQWNCGDPPPPNVAGLVNIPTRITTVWLVGRYAIVRVRWFMGPSFCWNDPPLFELLRAENSGGFSAFCRRNLLMLSHHDFFLPIGSGEIWGFSFQLFRPTFSTPPTRLSAMARYPCQCAPPCS